MLKSDVRPRLMRLVAHRARVAHRAAMARDHARWSRRGAVARGVAARAASTKTNAAPPVDGYAIGALLSWLRTHGVDVGRDATTVFGVSKTFGIGGVAVRDMDEGEVRGDARF